MKLVNLFYLVVVLSLTHSQSKAQSSFPIQTTNIFLNTDNIYPALNDMFWRNLHLNNTKNTLGLAFNPNKSIPNTVANTNLFHNPSFDINLNTTFQTTLHSINSEELTHFKQSINSIAKEVKQHQSTQLKEELEYYENLMNIYPNPLYNQAIVKFEIPKSGFGKLSVFDLTGKEVHNIAIGYFDKGNFEERLSRKNLSKGTYLVKLSVENYTETKKLVVAR